MNHKRAYKRPVSILAVIYTYELDVLLLERVWPAGQWQSVTGSVEPDESPLQAAAREVAEETGIDCPPEAFEDWQFTNRFRILEEWQPFYPPSVTHNTEHVFSLCLPSIPDIVTAPDEHSAHVWLPHDAAAEKVFSWTNRDAILQLPERLALTGRKISS